MHRSRTLFLTIVLSGVCMLNACAYLPQRQFARAEHLEKSGRDAEALQIYQKLLPEISTSAPQKQSQVYYRMGECLYRLERVSEAFVAFQKAVETEPTNMAARLRLGEFYLAAGVADRARSQAEQVLNRGGNNAEALALWGATMAATGEVDKARDAYERVLKMDPKRVSVAVALADLYNDHNQVQQARGVLEQAIEANPTSAAPLLALARLHEQEGQISAAEQAYRRAVRVEDAPTTNLRLAQFLQRTARINEAEQVLRRVDSQRPAVPTALPDFQLLSGKPADALDSYASALNAKETSSTKAVNTSSQRLAREVSRERALLATRLVEADLELGEQAKGSEQQEALQHARGHLAQYEADLDPATKAILEAEIALFEGDLPKAMRLSETAVTLAPKSAPAHYVLGLSQQRAGEDRDARAQWLAALDQDVHFAPARLMLGEQALRQHDSKAAEQYVIAVVRDEPGNVRALNLFARVLAAEGRPGAAGLIAHRALAVDSAAAEPHLVLGQIALEQHKLGEALIHFEQAVLAQPHSASAVEGLTSVYRTGHITRPILAKMERVAAAPPASAVLMEVAGRLYADHGWYEDAKRCLEQALRFNPKQKSAANALAKTYAATGRLGAAADSASRGDAKSAALLAAVRAEERNDVATAIENYERAVRQGDRSGVAANNLAWLYAKLGTNLDRALELAQSAMSMSPNNPAVLDTVGVVRLRLRKYSEAIKALESAKQIAGENPGDRRLLAQIRQHLTEAYLRAGQTDAAQVLAEEADGALRR